MFVRLALSLTIVCIVAACGAVATPPATLLPITLVAPEDRPTSTFTDPVLRAGQANYNLVCAHCHGYNGEGQHPDTIAHTLELGMLLVPAHDSTGHTWQHPDQLLIRTIQEGIQNPLDQFPMPPFSPGLSDQEIEEILAYIKLWWTDEQRAHQTQLTEAWETRTRELGLNE